MTKAEPSTRKSATFRRALYIGIPILIVAGIVWAVCPKFHAAGNHAHDSHAPTHRHAHDAGHASEFVPPQGERWATDAPLRLGMRRIREAAQPVLAAHEQGELTSAQARTLAATLNDQFAYMAEHCQLAPEADAGLHTIIVHLMQAASQLTEEPQSAAAATRTREAFDTYAASFDDPEWTAMELPR